MDEKIKMLFEDLPEKLRKQLFDEFRELHDEYIYGRYKPTELNAGRFCEIVYTIVKGYQNGNYEFEAKKPMDMVTSCRKLEQFRGEMPRSMKVLIPRLLPVLYEVRNNRNIGHVQGDIDPNYMDATFSFKAVSWIMAELIRVFHGLGMDGAQELVDQILASGNLPLIWDVNGRKRVLNNELSCFDKTLVILYDSRRRMDKELAADVKYSSLAMFRRRVLEKGDSMTLWEYDKETGVVTLSNLGVMEAEQLMKQFGMIDRDENNRQRSLLW